jgi:hypothetical protein
MSSCASCWLRGPAKCARGRISVTRRLLPRMDDRRVDVDELYSYIWVEGVNKSLTPGITNRRQQ